MKIFLIFFICATVCNGYISVGKDFDGDYDDTYYVGNPDDFAKIERPCQVYDLYCIRKFFANHANCTIASPNNPIPDPVFRSQDNVYVPSSNITVITNNRVTRGLSSTRVEEFYINEATDKLVFAINVRNLSHITSAVHLNFLRNRREPIVVVYDVTILFPSVTFTAVIPNIKNIRLDMAEVTAFLDAIPVFTLTPRSNMDPDPVVAAELADFSSKSATSIVGQEIMLTNSPYYPPLYIQNSICDFGLHVI